MSGPPCAKAGAAPAARMPAIPAPALPMNFLRSIPLPPLLVSRTLRRREPTLFPGERHAIDEDGTAVLGAAHHDVAPHFTDAAEHLQQVARDGDFLHREPDLATLDPEARRAARVIAGHHVHALAHHFGDDEAAAHQLHEPVEVVFARAHEEV